MAIKFIKQEVADLQGDGQTRVYYRAQSRGNVSWNDLVRHITRHDSGLDEGDIVKVMQAIVNCTSELLAEGHSVNLDGLGRFKLTIGLTETAAKATAENPATQHNAQSIEVKDINFHAEPRLIERVNRKCRFERGGESLIRKSEYTLDERRQLALQFLDTHPFMRVSDYAAMTGLSKSTASIELKAFRQDPDSGITSTGRRASLLYVKG